MEISKAQEIAQALFPHYPTVDAFHITADGQAFEQVHNAETHSTTLKDKEVIAVKRSDVEGGTPAVELTPDQELEKLERAVADAEHSLAAKQTKAAEAAAGLPKVNADKAVTKAQETLEAAKKALAEKQNPAA